MKSLSLFAAVLLIATLLVAVLPTEAEAKIYEDTLRLHILAASDSEADQALKICLRDKILEKYGRILAEAESRGEAEALVGELLSDIEANAQRWVRDWGYSYSVKATLTEEWYETREYEDFTLPAGVYTSLRVIIGSGEGKNWWCVMYPPLCIDIATENAPGDDALIDYTDAETNLITGDGYNIKFKLLEIISAIFSQNG